MLCPKCNQENPSDARFCGSCGATMPVAQPAPAPAPAPASDEPVSSNLNVGIIIGTIILPLLGIIMGLIYLQDPHPKKKAAGKLWLQIGIGWMIGSCLLAFMCGVFGNM